jgi:hypothetical protein
MPEKPKPSVAEQESHTDSVILGLLLDEGSERPWSVDEMALEVGDDAEDGLARLHAVGLVHRVATFVWASRAAVAAHAMDL